MFFIAGCAQTTRTLGQLNGTARNWSGRLALKLASDPPSALHAQFELSGSPQDGELRLFSPLGNTLAVLTWSTEQAQLQTSEQTRHYDSLADLVHAALHTDLPITALFAWLDGQALAADGWQADLSGRSEGRINAKRLHPEPQAELLIRVEP